MSQMSEEEQIDLDVPEASKAIVCFIERKIIGEKAIQSGQLRGSLSTVFILREGLRQREAVRSHSLNPMGSLVLGP